MKKLLFFAFLSILTCSAFAQIKVTTTGDIEVGSTTSAIVKMLMNGNNFIDASDASGNLVFRTGGTNDRFIIYSSGNAQFLGNLGIGVSNPSVALDVDGIISASGNISGAVGYFTDTSDYQLRLLSPDSWAGIKFQDTSNDDHIWFNGENQTFSIGGGGANVTGKKLHVHGGTSIGTGYIGSSVPTNGLAIEGNLGIGTANPLFKLDVSDAMRVYTDSNGLAYFQSTDGKAFIVVSDDDTTAFFGAENSKVSFGPASGTHIRNINIDTSNDYVGIGTQYPTSKLHIESDNVNVAISDKNQSNTNLGDTQSSLTLKGQYNSTSNDLSFSQARFRLIKDQANGFAGSTLAFDVMNAAGGNSVLTERMRIDSNGNVGIGTTDVFGHRLAVDGEATFNGDVDAVDFNVFLPASGGIISPWPDYVFKKDYQLLPLEKVEKHIKEKGHLPNIPSEKEVEEKGSFSLGEMTKKLLEKVEELTLYTIQQEKRIKALEAKLAKKKG